MTLFDIIVPVAALLAAGIGVLVVHATDKRQHRESRHPAE